MQDRNGHQRQGTGFSRQLKKAMRGQGTSPHRDFGITESSQARGGRHLDVDLDDEITPRLALAFGKAFPSDPYNVPIRKHTMSRSIWWRLGNADASTVEMGKKQAVET